MTNLFDRLPPTLFGPLTGRNNRRAWALLSRLYDQYFSPESVPPFAEGYLRDQLVREIERFLLDAGWEREAEDSVEDATFVQQANQLLVRLVETGWLTEDRVGLRRFVSMRPAVARFFETVQQFVNEGPQLFGGNVLMVYNQLKSVVASPEDQAQGFVTAAQLCVRLINSLSATTVRVRDLMKELTQENATSVFVKRFFSEHISELYVRDFQQLRTQNHPLRLRFEIIELVDLLANDASLRGKLIRGYAALPGNVSGEEEEYLDRDVQRFRRLLEVEKFLDRMDRTMDAATERAVAYLSYRLKASDRIEAVVTDTIRAVLRTDVAGLLIEGQLLTPDPLLAEENLRMPLIPAPKPKRIALVRREMTLEERARHILRKSMIAHRDASPAAVRRYVAACVPPGTRFHAQDLPVSKVEDAVAFLALTRLALIATHHPGALRRNPLLRDLDFAIELVDGQRANSPFFDTPDFVIHRRHPHAA
jgi:Family of unknown function (DUF5716)